MNYLGQPFPAADHNAINAAIADADEGVGALFRTDVVAMERRLTDLRAANRFSSSSPS